MNFNRVEISKEWEKLDVSTAVVRKSAEPLATINKSLNTVYLNKAATELAAKAGFHHKFVDLYQSGSEFALAFGSNIALNLYPNGIKTKSTPYGTINSALIAGKMYSTTKCRTFRVSVQEGRYLVITPAYDMDAQEVRQ